MASPTCAFKMLSFSPLEVSLSPSLFLLSRATEVISYLDRVHQQKKEGVKPSSPYLRLILEQARYTSQPKQDQELLKLIPSVSGNHTYVIFQLMSFIASHSHRES